MNQSLDDWNVLNVLNTAKSTEIESLNEKIAVMEDEKEKRESVENDVVKSSMSAKEEEIEELKSKLAGAYYVLFNPIFPLYFPSENGLSFGLEYEM